VRRDSDDLSSNLKNDYSNNPFQEFSDFTPVIKKKYKKTKQAWSSNILIPNQYTRKESKESHELTNDAKESHSGADQKPCHTLPSFQEFLSMTFNTPYCFQNKENH
jgi:hypothetical protein